MMYHSKGIRVVNLASLHGLHGSGTPAISSGRGNLQNPIGNAFNCRSIQEVTIPDSQEQKNQCTSALNEFTPQHTSSLIATQQNPADNTMPDQSTIVKLLIACALVLYTLIGCPLIALGRRTEEGRVNFEAKMKERPSLRIAPEPDSLADHGISRDDERDPKEGTNLENLENEEISSQIKDSPFNDIANDKGRNSEEDWQKWEKSRRKSSKMKKARSSKKDKI